MQEFILTFFYSGKAKKAPGTCGSAASVIFWLLLSYLFYKSDITLFWQNIFWLFFLSAAFFYGVVFAGKYSAKLGTDDHQSIVLDEMVGQIITLQISYFFLEQDSYFFSNQLLFHVLASFILFRFFDIKKPLFIGYCDRNFKNGFGVMFDDLVSGIVSAPIVYLLIAIYSSLQLN